MKTLNLILSLGLAGAAVMTAGCGSGLSGGNSNNSSTTTYTQIERLARPAVNEGLVLSDANLNAFNSIPPSLDLQSSIPAVAAVLTEATAVLTIVTTLTGPNPPAGGVGDPTAGEVAGQFLPDVMRISVDNADLTIAASASRTANEIAGEVGYVGCLSTTAGTPLLCGGRKIRDDVIDITLSYIVVGASGVSIPYPVTDDVGYDAGHGTLLGAFPFLARPM